MRSITVLSLNLPNLSHRRRYREKNSVRTVPTRTPVRNLSRCCTRGRLIDPTLHRTQVSPSRQLPPSCCSARAARLPGLARVTIKSDERSQQPKQIIHVAASVVAAVAAAAGAAVAGAADLVRRRPLYQAITPTSSGALTVCFSS